MSETSRRDTSVLKQFRTPNPVTERLNLAKGVWRRVRLTWSLMGDPRVRLAAKAIPVGILIYIVSPVDLVPTFIAGIFGVVDEIVVATIGLDLFFRLVPDDVLLDHIHELGFDQE